jgi:hypothetical protein
MVKKEKEPEAKPANPDQLLAQIRLFSKMALDAASRLRLEDAALRTSQAASAATQLDQHIMNGGALPSEWAEALAPKYNPDHIWVDSSTMMICCIEMLIANKDDPDFNKEGSETRCERCGSHLALRGGAWKHGLPAMKQDYSGMTSLSALPKYLADLRSDPEWSEDE